MKNALPNVRQELTSNRVRFFVANVYPFRVILEAAKDAGFACADCLSWGEQGYFVDVIFDTKPAPGGSGHLSHA